MYRINKKLMSLFRIMNDNPVKATAYWWRLSTQICFHHQDTADLKLTIRFRQQW